jgi:hypothetical protein
LCHILLQIIDIYRKGTIERTLISLIDFIVKKGVLVKVRLLMPDYLLT